MCVLHGRGEQIEEGFKILSYVHFELAGIYKFAFCAFSKEFYLNS